jgi:hypothetical protein
MLIALEYDSASFFLDEFYYVELMICKGPCLCNMHVFCIVDNYPIIQDLINFYPDRCRNKAYPIHPVIHSHIMCAW